MIKQPLCCNMCRVQVKPPFTKELKDFVSARFFVCRFVVPNPCCSHIKKAYVPTCAKCVACPSINLSSLGRPKLVCTIPVTFEPKVKGIQVKIKLL